MTKRGRKPRIISLTIGSEPSLWKYASLDAALRCNIILLAALIDDFMPDQHVSAESHPHYKGEPPEGVERAGNGS